MVDDMSPTLDHIVYPGIQSFLSMDANSSKDSGTLKQVAFPLIAAHSSLLVVDVNSVDFFDCVCCLSCCFAVPDMIREVPSVVNAALTGFTQHYFGPSLSAEVCYGSRYFLFI